MKHRTVSLGSIATITSGGTPDRKQAAYWSGDIPWVKTAQIQNGIIGPDDIEEWITHEGLKQSSAKIIPKGTLLMAMYGQGKTRGQVAILGLDAAINQACAAIQLKSGVDRDYVYQQLLFRYQTIRALSNSGSQENLNAELIREISFPLPDLPEQQAVAREFDDWDSSVKAAERMIDLKEKLYVHELSKLIHRTHYPRTHIGAIANDVSERNRQQIKRVLSVTNTRGFALPEEQFERRVASDDLSNYKVVRRGQYAYNPSRINVGSIARLDGWDDGVLSPMYVVFSLDESKVNSDYFLHWLASHEARERIKKSAQGSVRETVSFSALATLAFPMPELAKQEAISRYLNALRHEIVLLDQSVAAIKKQKRGLMQKLLTGQWNMKSLQEEAS